MFTVPVEFVFDDWPRGDHDAEPVVTSRLWDREDRALFYISHWFERWVMPLLAS